MTLDVGDKVVSVRTKTGVALTPVDSLAIGGKVVTIQTANGPVVVPVNPASVGDKCLMVPDKRGKHIALVQYVNPCPKPVANFSASAAIAYYCPPAPITFTDLSTHSPTSWLWDFGDGSTSTSQNPSHLFAIEGTYDVSLIASNACGSSLERIKRDLITSTYVPAIFENDDPQVSNPFNYRISPPDSNANYSVSTSLIGTDGIHFEIIDTNDPQYDIVGVGLVKLGYTGGNCAKRVDFDYSLNGSHASAAGYGSSVSCQTYQIVGYSTYLYNDTILNPADGHHQLVMDTSPQEGAPYPSQAHHASYFMFSLGCYSMGETPIELDITNITYS